MSASLFSEHFWGDKHTGFDVIFQNFKTGLKCSADFSDFLRESAVFDDTNCRAMVKFSKQIANYNSSGSFKYSWAIMKKFFQQLGQVNFVMSRERQHLFKDVQKYMDEQQKINKSMKDIEASNHEVINAFQVNINVIYLCY